MTSAAVDDVSAPQREATRDVDTRYAKGDISAETQGKINRLSHRLLPAISGQGAGALVFGQVGSAGSSSLWLTTSLASMLGEMLSEQVHVLAIRESGKMAARPLQGWSVLEYVSARGGIGENTDISLDERLQDLMRARRKVMVHLADADTMTKLAIARTNISGFVFLARASQTRKAVLEVLQAKLGQLDIPILGAVLLDRAYPIPERLYRML